MYTVSVSLVCGPYVRDQLFELPFGRFELSWSYLKLTNRKHIRIVGARSGVTRLTRKPVVEFS